MKWSFTHVIAAALTLIVVALTVVVIRLAIDMRGRIPPAPVKVIKFIPLNGHEI